MENIYCKLEVASIPQLVEGNNFQIESMTEFFESQQHRKLFENVSFIRNDMDISVRVSSANGQKDILENGWNYASFYYQDQEHTQITRNFYCFIRKITQISPSTFDLKLHIDTLNSFFHEIKMTSKTHIVREHKDRFSLVADNSKMKQVIDRYPEGLNVNLVRKYNYGILPNGPRLKWYLIYQTKDDLTVSQLTNPVSVSCVPEAPVTLNVTNPNVITPEMLDEGKVYFVLASENEGGTTSISATAVLFDNYTQDTGYFVSEIQIWKENGNINVFYLNQQKTGNNYIVDPSSTVPSLTLHGITKVRICSYATTAGSHSEAFIISQTVGYLAVGSESRLTAFSQIDRSNSKLMKVIELPYAPFTPVWTERHIPPFPKPFVKMDIPDGWHVNNGVLVADNVSAEMLDRVSNNQGFLPFSFIIDKPAKTSVENTLYTSINDPKIYHSEFNTIKYVYDSFSYEIKPELVVTYDSNPVLSIDFKPTNTINSKFLFELNMTNFSYDSLEDYPLIILSSRNNEKTIFTNDYLNYIRTGYNYDLKKNQSNLTASILGSALAIGGGVASTAVGGAFGKAFGVSAVASGASSLVSLINQGFQQDNSMKSKLQTLAYQSSGVSGADDLDLFDSYSGNYLRYITYTPNDYITSMLNSLFHFYGYKCNYFGIPKANTRYWFNYVQCEPVVYYRDLSFNITSEMVADYCEKFREGVTLFHYHPDQDEAWDLGQMKENLEMSIYNTLE